MLWFGADTGTNVFYFQARCETEALAVAQKDFGTSMLAGSLPVVLGEFHSRPSDSK